MELLDKLAGLKKRVEEIDTENARMSKELSSQLKGIQTEMSILEEINNRLDTLTLKFSNDIDGNKSKLDSIETHTKKNLDNFSSGLVGYDKKIKEVEDKITDFKGILKKQEAWIDEVDKRSIDNKDTKAKKVVEVEADVKKLQKETEKLEKELNKVLLETPTDKDMKDVLRDISKLKREVDTKVSEDSVEKIKRATQGIDQVIENSLIDIRNEFDEVKTKMEDLVELRNLHKHFAELKMDVTSTEAGLIRNIDEVKQEVDMLKQEWSKVPEFRELAGQDKALRANIEKIEARLNADLEKIVGEFDKLGIIFAKKSEFDMENQELKSEINKLAQTMSELDSKHTHLEKEIVIREDTKDKNVSDRVEEALSQIQFIFDEFQKQSETSRKLESEFLTLKDQIITTQNAVMELNGFIQEQLR